VLIINFKNYPQVLGPQALKLTQDLFSIAQEFPQVEVGFAPPPAELAEVAAHTEAPIWAQHADPSEEEQTTGFFSPLQIKDAGAIGTFLNHSEHPMDKESLVKAVNFCKEAGLKILLLARNPKMVAELSALKPDLIGYEPPELIGGKISVSTAKTEIIKEAVVAANGIPFLVGAGIHKTKDIEIALKLGAVGALVSSAVITSPTPQSIFKELLAGFKS